MSMVVRCKKNMDSLHLTISDEAIEFVKINIESLEIKNPVPVLISEFHCMKKMNLIKIMALLSKQRESLKFS